MEAQADAVVDRYRERAAQVRSAVGEDSPTVSLLRVRADDMRLYQRSSYSGIIVDDVGLPRPESSNYDANFVEVSLETLDTVDADIVLVAVDSSIEASTVEEFFAQPIWQKLRAEQEGNVHKITSEFWIAGGGYQGAMEVLDELDAILRASTP